MTKHEVAILSFKVLCIYAVIQAIDKFYSFLYYVFNEPNLDYGSKLNILIASVPSLLMALISVLLWFGSPLLARTIFKRSTSETEPPSSLADIQRIAFSVVGLFLLSTSLPDLVEIIIVIISNSIVQSGLNSIVHSIVALLVKVSLGFWLLFGAGGIVNFVRYMNGERKNF